MYSFIPNQYSNQMSYPVFLSHDGSRRVAAVPMQSQSSQQIVTATPERVMFAHSPATTATVTAPSMQNHSVVQSLNVPSYVVNGMQMPLMQFQMLPNTNATAVMSQNDLNQAATLQFVQPVIAQVDSDIRPKIAMQIPQAFVQPNHQQFVISQQQQQVVLPVSKMSEKSARPVHIVSNSQAADIQTISQMQSKIVSPPTSSTPDDDDNDDENDNESQGSGNRSKKGEQDTDPWTIDEDKLLISLYDEMGSKWSYMATFFKNRSRIQLKTRYKSICRARTKMWSAAEDKLLLEKCKDHGQSTNWGEIVSLFPKRTKNSLRVRYSELTNSKFRIHKTPNLGSPFQALFDESISNKKIRDNDAIVEAPKKRKLDSIAEIASNEVSIDIKPKAVAAYQEIFPSVGDTLRHPSVAV